LILENGEPKVRKDQSEFDAWWIRFQFGLWYLETGTGVRPKLGTEN